MGTLSLLILSAVSIFLLLLGYSAAQTTSRPRAVRLPLKKDAATQQYLTCLNQRTPLVPLILAVDLGGQYMWVNCEGAYVSSSYRPIHCDSCPLGRSNSCGQCDGPPRPGCNNNTCGAFPENPFIGLATIGEIAADVISVVSNPRSTAVVSQFVFVCGRRILLRGLPNGASGVAGLGRTRIALPLQFASSFEFSPRFALCLPSSTSAEGVIFFGNGEYNLLPNIRVSQFLTYTPLYINPVSTAGTYFTGERSVEYFIGVKSITIGEHPLRINNTLLTIHRNGYGGTKISTVNDYTQLETSIYLAFTSGFTREAQARNISRVVPGVAPFEFCYSRRNVLSTRVGPSVPNINLGLDGENAPVWTITGSNSMVVVNDEVLCLGFMDGGENPRTSIVIGGFQIEDNLLQFNLRRSSLGFSSTLLGRRTTCSNSV